MTIATLDWLTYRANAITFNELNSSKLQYLTAVCIFSCACLSTQQVISAQQLPKINKDKHKSIVDPLVKVEIHGVSADNASKVTPHITNNGEHHKL